MQFSRQVPFFRLCLFLVSGVLLQHCFNLQVSFSLLAIVAFALISLFLYCSSTYTIRGLSGLPISVCYVILGIMSSQLVNDLRVRELPPEILTSTQIYTGEILEVKTGKKGVSLSLLLLAGLDSSNRVNCLRTGAIVYLNDTTQGEIRPGSYLSFSARLHEIPEPDLHYHFNAKSYYESKGIYYRAFISENRFKVTKKQGFSFEYWRSGILDAIRNCYNTYGFNSRDKEYLMALVLGAKTALAQSLKQAYQNLGISHILAVSGLHVGIIWLLLSLILSFVFLGKRSVLKYLFGLVLLWLYILITGAGSSVIRAGIMISFYVFSLILKRKSNSLNTILSAAFIMLFWNPAFLFDIGFQLSFAAVIGIVSCMPILSRGLEPLPLIPKKILELSSVSLVAQMATLPVSLYYFGNFPLFFLPANLLFLPSLALELYSAIALILLFPFQSLIKPLANLIRAFLTYKNDIIMKFSDRFGQGVMLNLDSEISVVLLYVIFIMVGLILLRRQFYLLKFLLILGIVYGVVEIEHKLKPKQEHWCIVRKGNDYWAELAHEDTLYAIADTGLSKWDYYLQEAEKNFQKIRIYHPDSNLRTTRFAIKNGYLVTNDTLVNIRGEEKLRLSYSVP